MEVIDFSETEMEAAEQLVQLSEDDTLSCSSGTGLSVSGCEGGFHRKRHSDVISDEVQNDGVVRTTMNNNATDAQCFVKAITETNIIRRRYKKKKFRSLASLYRATKEMTTDELI
ncbi:hypothetical protein HID58_000051 [Brassica napus]|uniref:Peptidase C1A papain C-terminal domain-containing protein n=1 Tax=Brassica napus TaxID=3708 RepID=A0ABQ8EFF2_BRANA|nr:uncharacterized protein LOC106395997 [Brassica napus]KAH0940414.1 hypothetical protein HID58_000051 [Brassica napus]